MYSILYLLLAFSAVLPSPAGEVTEIVPGLEVEMLTPRLYRHIAWMQHDQDTRFQCNGAVFIHNGEAAIFDTPMYDSLCLALLEWIEVEKKAKVTAVVVNHFHFDCNGGLEVFKSRGIPTYALEGGCELASAEGNPCAEHHFQDSLVLRVGGEQIINRYFGHAHSADNIFSYFPGENALFGGCPVKSLKSGRGFLGDADTLNWPIVIEKVDKAYPNLETVIPGHGLPGGRELLEFTKAMFRR